MTKFDYPILVIGAGAGGLVIAIGAAKAGKKVLLVERGSYGGDCTNFGCIPSKTLIHSARVAHLARTAADVGIHLKPCEINCEEALEHTRSVVQHYVNHEGPEALEKLGVETLTGRAEFIDPHTIKVHLESGGSQTVTAKDIVIATGSGPSKLPIKGLDDVPFLTNQSIFSLTAIPQRLAIIGGGAIGCELAQAFQRLGSSVTLVEYLPRILSQEDSEAGAIIREILDEEGIQLRLGYETTEVSKSEGGIKLSLHHCKDHHELNLNCDALLLAAGRKPHVEGLGLETIGVNFDSSGIKINAYGQTNIPHIWAVGDSNGLPMFTHMAENQARSVLTSLILPFFLKSKFDSKQLIPRVTFTDPEVASLGCSELEAIQTYGAERLAIYLVPMSEVDRAVCTHDTRGFVKIITKKWSGKILGASIVCHRAGEVMGEIAAAAHGGVSLRKLATLIHPYPTYGQGVRKAADQWLTKTILPTLMSWIGK